nr:hypothetical protein [uncultured Actinoplanes sp.]
MRHFRSILYALVLAPAVWVLAAVGLTHDLTTRGRDDFAVESITGLLLLVLGGAAYAILVFAPISPAGPMVAGLAFLGVSAWALQAPSAYAGLWPQGVAKEGFDLSRPGYGLAALLAVPLICTALSARRWERYEPPVLPIIGRIGRVRGAATVAGTPIAAVETTPLPRRGVDPDATTLLPGRRTDPDPTTVLRLPASSDNTTTVIASGDDTTVIRSAPDEATVTLDGEDPTVVVAEADTAVVVSGDDEPTEVSSGEGSPVDGSPSPDAEPADDEPTAAVPGGSAVAAPDEPKAGTSAADDDEPETVASETVASETVPSGTAAPQAARRPIPLPRAVPAEERTQDLSDRTDPERTRVIRLPLGDQGEQTQIVRLPGEQTRVIPFPGGGDDTEVIRLPVRADDQENTQVIRPTVEPPRTDVIQFPIRNGAKEERPSSIADAEAPDTSEDPTSRIVPPEPRRDEDAPKRSMTVMNMERPPDDDE